MAAGDLKFSGAISLSNMMTTDLNALGSTKSNIGGTALYNTSSHHQNFVAELVLASVDLSAQVNPAVELYLVPSADGTNYADDGTDDHATNLPSSRYLAGIFSIEATNAAHRAVIVMTGYLLNLKYLPVVVNKTGANFGATGNTLKIGTNAYMMAQS
jgi:hypothetical protein